MKIYIVDFDLMDEGELYKWLRNEHHHIWEEWLEIKKKEMSLLIAQKRISRKLR